MTLREYATKDWENFLRDQGDEIPSDPQRREATIGRWMHMLVTIGLLPDELLAAMPKISRHNEPQDSPQEYECGCIVVTRITDRDYRYKMEPFEMRLAIPCDGTNCVRHISLLDASVAEALLDADRESDPS